MTVADSERDLELQKRKLGKEKEGLILQNHDGCVCQISLDNFIEE